MEDKIIKKAKKILKSYPHHNNKYYQELKKSYEEYNNTDIFDTESRELYIKYIDQLNSCLEEDRYSNFIITFMFIMLVGILSLTGYTAKEYEAIAKNLEENVILSKDDVSIIVDYENTSNFNALNDSSEEDYLNLTPLTINVSSKSDVKNSYTIKYMLYLVEENSILEPVETIDRNEFNYALTINNENKNINNLGELTVNEDGSILLYSGTILAGEVDRIDLRIWLNNVTDILSYQNKSYRFKLDVKGYVL